MSHVNHFLPEIGRRQRRQFKEAIIANRVAGATKDSYDNYMRHLRQAERKTQVETQRLHGRHVPMTYEEQLKLESQQHVRFNQLSAEEQQRLTAERESLWGQIPAHLQAKARKMAGR